MRYPFRTCATILLFLFPESVVWPVSAYWKTALSAKSTTHTFLLDNERSTSLSVSTFRSSRASFHPPFIFNSVTTSLRTRPHFLRTLHSCDTWRDSWKLRKIFRETPVTHCSQSLQWSSPWVVKPENFSYDTVICSTCLPSNQSNTFS